MIEYVDRRGSDCYKWDSDHVRSYMMSENQERPENQERTCVSAQTFLPMWVADMDFKAAPPIIAALERRLQHGVFGYQYVPQAYYDAISSWFSRRHGWNGITREQLIYTIGVVPAISAILRALSDRKRETHSALDGHSAPLRVITFTPAYNCFFSSISNTGCELVSCPLAETTVADTEPSLHFTIDMELFERLAADADVLLLCNPHNPTGRVWTRDELSAVAHICRQNNIFVISDEIHCEFTFPGQHYTPFATVAEPDLGYCVCTSASKAFNIAGLQCANIYVPDADIRSRIDKAINIHEVCDISPFGMTALMAAYNESEAWLDELQQVLHNNYLLLCEHIGAHHSGLHVTLMEGTYLAWVDVRGWLQNPVGSSNDKNAPRTAEELCDRLAREQQVLFNPSDMYGADGFIRINLATSKENIIEALRRLEKFV